jgi:N-acetyl-anhydromuramyl-L-alanine amidase AmpD
VEERRIPAVYRTVRKPRLVTPERTETVVVPAEWRTVERSRPAGPTVQAWREAPCARQVTPDLIRRLQETLNARGYNVGRPDGVFGGRTREALEQFQRDRGLHSGALTLEALQALNITP